MKAAPKNGFSRSYLESRTYPCAFEWPDDCRIQCGDSGLVLRKNDESYLTAFFEAFPSVPNTFIRGEGQTIELAEADAWQQYQQIIACEGEETMKFEGGNKEVLE